jgi:hypothetical protein
MSRMNQGKAGKPISKGKQDALRGGHSTKPTFQPKTMKTNVKGRKHKA